MITYAEIADEALFDVPTAAHPLVAREARNATRLFCELSYVWRKTVVTGNMAEGVTEYALTLPVDSRVVKIHQAYYSDFSLEPTSEALIHAIPGGHLETGDPRYYSHGDGGVKVYPIPEVAGTEITAVVSLKPIRTSTQVDADFADNYFEYLVAGTLAEMLSRSGMPYYDPNLAAYFGTKFSDGVTLAKRKSEGDDTAKTRVTSYGGL